MYDIYHSLLLIFDIAVEKLLVSLSEAYLT